VTARRRTLIVALALAAACIAVYAPAVRCEFLNYDDNGYITDNPTVRAGLTPNGVRWAFTELRWFYWQPLTWLSHMLDCQIFGLHPAGHHVVSIAFHIANVLLLLAILLRLTGAFWRSAAAAAIFGLHPLRAESVVWIAERKDLLSGVLFLGAIWLYLRYVERPSNARYGLVLLALVLGLMAKPMVMTLPVILLLLDWWPLKRRAFAEKAPMFFLALVSMFITSIGTASLGIINWGSSLTVGERIANTLVSYMRYLQLSIWPEKLAILYPFRLAVPLWESALAALLLAAITFAAAAQARRRPYLIVGWLWFALALAPASGITQVGRQGMADRFTYLPQIGLIIAAVWAAADLARNRRILACTLAVAAVTAFAVRTAAYVPVWQDSVTVFSNAIAVTAENSGAQHYLAAALDDRGRYAEALPHHAESVRIEPGYFVAHSAYGAALERQGDLAAARDQYQLALHSFPEFPDARNGLQRVQEKLDLSKASGFKLKSEQ
jgi:protein O-mannosyl-transferase